MRRGETYSDSLQNFIEIADNRLHRAPVIHKPLRHFPVALNEFLIHLPTLGIRISSERLRKSSLDEETMATAVTHRIERPGFHRPKQMSFDIFRAAWAAYGARCSPVYGYQMARYNEVLKYYFDAVFWGVFMRNECPRVR
jgi:hypothetical protein